MHTHEIHRYQHDHVFGQDEARAGEKRTLIVIVVTATMMVVEIAAGIAFGSMALLADGLHMASHAAALTITYVAYVYARRFAGDSRFSFGTGKVNALGGFTGAILLGVFAFMMVYESIHRLISPVEIQFNAAIGVAIIGLIINAASAVILNGGGGSEGGGHGHDHGHSHSHAHAHSHSHGHSHDHHDDHNLRAAYLHVLADALTSVLAIAALLAGKYIGLNFLDPVMGIVGSLLVGSWAFGLMRTTSRTLLDHEAPDELRGFVRERIENVDDNRVADLHIWSIGPGIYAAEVAIVTHHPKNPAHYKQLIDDDDLPLVHITCEVHRCEDS